MKKKIIYGICACICVIVCVLPFQRADKDVAFQEMQKSVGALVKEADFKKEDKKYIRKQYKLDDVNYENIICYGPPSAMEVNEFSVVSCKDAVQKTLVKEQLQKHVDEQYQSFLGYAPRQADLLNKAVLYEKGNYIILIVHKDANMMKQKIDDLF